MTSAFQIAASRPWLIEQDSLESILQVSQRYGDPEALAARIGRPLDNTRTVTMRGGVAVIPVTGPIFRYANLFSEISGATSTQVLATDIQAALDNKYVTAIVLDINSPGGEASGINELAKLIAAGRSSKRIVAYAGGSMASGAYWLGSAAHEIVVDETAALGSIGVVMSFMDTTARDAKLDVRRVEIVSSQSPDKRLDPVTDEGRVKVQDIVDALADVFVSAVAVNRATTKEKVLSDFGRGGVLIGAAAVTAGMANRIGSLESVIAELAGSASNSQRDTSMSSGNGQITVSNTEDLRQALAAGYKADQITIASNEAAIAAARQEGETAGKAAAVEGAVKAERDRVTGLQALGRQGFEAELKAAIDEGQSTGAFALALMQAASDRGVTLDAIRKDAPTPAPHTPPDNGGNQKASWDGAVAKLGGK